MDGLSFPVLSYPILWCAGFQPAAGLEIGHFSRKDRLNACPNRMYKLIAQATSQTCRSFGGAGGFACPAELSEAIIPCRRRPWKTRQEARPITQNVNSAL